MSDATAEELLRIVHQYYPVGFPLETDARGSEPDPYQLTPEFQRWQALWQEAIEVSQPWITVFKTLSALFPGQTLESLTQPYHSSCFVSSTQWPTPLPDGQEGQRIVHVAGAVSLLAPVYLVYGTVELRRPKERRQRTRRAVKALARPGPRERRLARFQQELSPGPELFLHPTEEMQPFAERLAHHLEHTLGYRRFPPALADFPIPDVRVPYLNLEQPTLLNAVFKPSLEYL